MTTPNGNAGALALGPGKLFWAPLGTPLPVDLADALNAAFKLIGYTEEGSTFNYAITTEPVEVAEEVDRIFTKTTGREGSVDFAMAEVTARNMTLAFNGGTVTRTTSGAIKYTPPAVGTEVRRILVWQSEDGEERWVYPQVFQAGSVAMARRKGAAKTTVPVSFALEKPASGGQPFEVYFDDERDGGTGVVPAATTP